MEIQWSLVLFTALSGAGAWLVACAGLDAFKGLAKKTVVPAVVTGIVLIIVGGIASATHLSHVDRIMAVLAQNRASMTKSRSDTASMLLSNVPYMSSSRATDAGSSG